LLTSTCSEVPERLDLALLAPQIFTYMLHDSQANTDDVLTNTDKKIAVNQTKKSINASQTQSHSNQLCTETSPPSALLAANLAIRSKAQKGVRQASWLSGNGLNANS